MSNVAVVSAGLGRPVVVDFARKRIEVGREATAPQSTQRAEKPSPEMGSATALDRTTGLGPDARAGLVQSRFPDGDGAQASADGLTEAQREQVDELAARDVEVRRHEEAHARVGGAYAGQPSYTYQQGPDGRRYAVGGEVQIDVAPIPGDPEATISKMDVVKRAALAPAEPSGADRRVAALADAQRLEAVAEMASMRAADRMAALAETTGRGPEVEPGQVLDLAA